MSFLVSTSHSGQKHSCTCGQSCRSGSHGRWGAEHKGMCLESKLGEWHGFPPMEVYMFLNLDEVSVYKVLPFIEEYSVDLQI